ncbi:MAG: adenosylcobinamide-phosphate synthase CbiB [Puniceicoccales bacterium]
MNLAAFALLLAILLDFAIGDPRYPFHPVRLIGHLITRMERFLRSRKSATYLGGIILWSIAQAIPIALFAALYYGFHHIPGASFAFSTFVVYSCLGMGDLIRHAKPIADALARSNIAYARERVSWIVGRDVSRLDESGIARATVESVSENFVDAFLAPVFWFAAGSIAGDWLGLPPLWGGTAAILAYRITNTLDAMVGYRNERFLEIGCASARMDDALNFIPARFSIPLISLAAQLSGNRAIDALRVGWRDRNHHPSPNSAHAESATAGALGISLGGPTPYAHGVVEKPWLNDGAPAPESSDILRTNRLCTVSAIIGGGFALALLLLLI